MPAEKEEPPYIDDYLDDVRFIVDDREYDVETVSLDEDWELMTDDVQVCFYKTEF